jgi:hypothetical protein
MNPCKFFSVPSTNEGRRCVCPGAGLVVIHAGIGASLARKTKLSSGLVSRDHRLWGQAELGGRGNVTRALDAPAEKAVASSTPAAERDILSASVQERATQSPLSTERPNRLCRPSRWLDPTMLEL